MYEQQSTKVVTKTSTSVKVDGTTTITKTTTRLPEPIAEGRKMPSVSKAAAAQVTAPFPVLPFPVKKTHKTTEMLPSSAKSKYPGLVETSTGAAVRFSPLSWSLLNGPKPSRIRLDVAPASSGTARNFGSFLTPAGSPRGSMIVKQAGAGTLQWHGEIVPGQGEKTLTGSSAKNIRSQINAVNPAYERFANMTTAGESLIPLEDTQIMCGKPDKLPRANRVLEGIRHVETIRGDLEVIPCRPSIKDKKTCKWQLPIEGDSDKFNCNAERVSCSHETAIHMVNCNLDKPMRIPAHEVAQIARQILSECCRDAAGSNGCSSKQYAKLLDCESGGIWQDRRDEWYIDVRSTQGLGDDC